MVSARRFKDLGAGAAQVEMNEVAQLDSIPRELQTLDLKKTG